MTRSNGRLSRLLKIYWLQCAGCALIVLQLVLLVYSAWTHSPAGDEIAYLPAGISHWQLGRFELARVSPPLVRACAAVPVILFGKPVTDWRAIAEGSGSRPEWIAGPRFVELNGPRTFWLFTLGRWGCLPFAVLGALVCWRWAFEAYGKLAGAMAVWLWCLCPNILGHAALVTPDIGGAAMGAWAGYLYWRWLRLSGGWRAAGAGVGLGLALLTRTTWIVLIPVWVCGWITCRIGASSQVAAKTAPSCRGLVGLLAIALYVLNLGYGFTGSFQQLADFTFVSQSLSGNSDSRAGNRFAETWIGKLPMPIPRDYVEGIDLQRRDFEFRGWSFLAGERREGGWWHYYFYGLAVKLPLGVLALLGIAAILSIRNWRRADLLTEFMLLAPIMAVLLAVSLQTNFSHHVRYAYGILPFLFVWISKVAQAFSPRRSWVAATVVVLLVWQGVSGLAVYPHSLSYFNELAGGPLNGQEHLVDSNIDWGQDLLSLRRWIRERDNSLPLYLAYYGHVNPALAGIEFELPPLKSELPDDSRAADALAPGLYAISTTLLQGQPHNLNLADGTRRYAQSESFSYFKQLEPVDRVGYSMLIYRVPAESKRQKSSP